MNCFHCYYPFSKVFESEDENIDNYYNNSKIGFQGYFIFDENYNFEIYRFCSLNCALKYIVDSNENLVKKLKNFFNFYAVDSKILKQALPIKRLKIFSGDLSYEQYRKDFVCPKIFDKLYEESYSIQSITYENFPMYNITEQNK